MEEWPVFRFNDQLLRPVLPLFNFKINPAYLRQPRNPSFSMIARYINLIVVSNFIIQSAYTRFNWIKRNAVTAFLIRDVNTIIKSKKNWKWKSRGFKENDDLLRYSSRRLNALNFFFNLRIRR